MYFLLKIGIFQPAMLVYQRVAQKARTCQPKSVLLFVPGCQVPLMGNELFPFCELHPVSCSVQGGPGVDGCKLLDLFL